MTTILISRTQVGLLRATVEAHIDQAVERRAEGLERPGEEGPRIDALDAVRVQLADAEHRVSDASLAVDGTSDVLFSLLYDIVGQQAERVQEECLDYWRGTSPEAIARSIEELGEWFALLVRLGPPPGT
jgi:hypothetical protein